VETAREAPLSFGQRLTDAVAASDVVFDCVGLLFTMGHIAIPSHVLVFQEASGAADGYYGALTRTIKFGFCGLPTLLNRRLLEVSLYQEADRAKLAEACAALGTDYRVVADRVGLVTPRVICQIINEACFTVQEGTATMQDVDLGMKLGTNYPRGPFAWANAIGVERVYAVLEALWQDTHDERYKVCPLLKRQALRGEPFAV
jgi:3-hydroxybutyryl-CoA dehydrogenase